MSNEQPPASPSGGWVPPSGWSPEQPPAWPGSGQPPAQGAGPQGPGAPQPGHPPPSPPPGQGGWGQPAPGSAPGAWGQPAHPWGPMPQAPKPGIVPLRPLGVGELLDGALGLIRSNPRTVLGLAATISALSALIQTVGVWATVAILDTSLTVSTTSSGNLEADLTSIATAGVAQLIPGLMAGFLQVLASGLFIVLVAAAVLGHRLDAGATWERLRPRLAALVGLTLLITVLGLAALAAVVGIIVLLAVALGGWAVLPGLVLGVGAGLALAFAYVKLAIAAPALVIEGLSPIAAMRRSWALVRGSWWRVLGILVLSALITNLLTAVVSVPISMVAALVTGVSETLWPSVVAAGVTTLVAGIVTLPFGAAVTGLLYTDLRMRREALDIQLIATGVDPAADPLAAYRRTG